MHIPFQWLFCFICVAVDCGPLENVLNGFVTLNETTLGSVATYSCISGFRVENSSQRMCEATGQWSGVLPTCQRKYTRVTDE